MLTTSVQPHRVVTVSLLAALAIIGGMMATLSSPLAAEDAASAPRLFEMRTYTTNDGKFDDLLSRFRDHTVTIFKKHGMTNVAYWTPIKEDGEPDTLVYVLAYPNREARNVAWKAFIADPEWQKAYRESIADGKLVKKIESVFMNATDFSPIQ